MARLQILELPEGSNDDRPPFLLIVDQVDDELAEDIARWPDDIAKRTGAQHVLCFPGTVDIPANDTSAYFHNTVESGAETERDKLHAELGLAPGQLHSAALSAIRGKHANIRELIGRAEQAEAERDEARQWARHGYEIGQKHCSWSDHGVAPDWLTDGWPPHIDSCEHLKHAAELEEAEAVRKRVAKEQKAALTDALGMDRLRDWDDILNAARGLRTRRDAQAEAIDRVRDLHRPVDHRGVTICWECSAYDLLSQTTDNSPCGIEHCSTLKALSGERTAPDA
ncbi:hypothetical protein [Streptomyces sp. STCH 565 A]|uniref:hypothetical protein n=1 Tax=Streptomyces sp. STCH 565 A TaxID=2950532 RepID=UPI0020754A18|nr:hypothetical protein [Streptomyces sp. STCH 565 A]MCM8552327.1 hypothetical protein [Streptomyces sp. STCH 565 A]